MATGAGVEICGAETGCCGGCAGLTKKKHLACCKLLYQKNNIIEYKISRTVPCAIQGRGEGVQGGRAFLIGSKRLITSLKAGLLSGSYAQQSETQKSLTVTPCPRAPCVGSEITRLKTYLVPAVRSVTTSGNT